MRGSAWDSDLACVSDAAQQRGGLSPHRLLTLPRVAFHVAFRRFCQWMLSHIFLRMCIPGTGRRPIRTWWEDLMRGRSAGQFLRLLGIRTGEMFLSWAQQICSCIRGISKPSEACFILRQVSTVLLWLASNLRLTCLDFPSVYPASSEILIAAVLVKPIG